MQLEASLTLSVSSEVPHKAMTKRSAARDNGFQSLMHNASNSDSHPFYLLSEWKAASRLKDNKSDNNKEATLTDTPTRMTSLRRVGSRKVTIHFLPFHRH